MPVTKRTQSGQKAIRGHDDATTTLDWFDENRGILSGCGDFRYATKREMIDEVTELFGERPAEVASPCGVERAVGETMVRAGKRDDAGTFGVDCGGLDGGFDGFRAGVGEENTGGRLQCQRDEFPGEAQFQFVGMHVAHRVEELPGLTPNRSDDARVAVADAGDAEAGGQIKVTIAVHVPDVAAGSAFPEDRPAGGDVGDVAGFVTVELPGERAGARPGNAGLE